MFTILLSLLIQGGVANADQFEVLDGPGLCAWYRQPDGCYRRTLEVLSTINSTPAALSNDKKTCVFPDGSRLENATSMDWMFSGDLFDPSLRKDWNFVHRDSAGNIQLQVIAQTQDAFNFTITGHTVNNKYLRASYANTFPGDTSILGTAKCDMYNSKGSTVYIIPWESWYAAKTLCVDQFLAGGRLPTMSIRRSSFGHKAQVEPYIHGPDAEYNLFSCRNY